MKTNGEYGEKTKLESFLRGAICTLCIILAALAVSITLIAYLRQQKSLRTTRKAISTETMQENGSANPTDEALEAEDAKFSEGIRIHSLQDFGDEKWNEGRVFYDGKAYQYKSGLQNYLFFGIDNDNKVAPAEDGISGGQSDAIFLVVTDRNTQEIRVIAINRNTIVPVDVYDREGNFVVQMDLQICLQHGYGDGMKLSCVRSVDAVNRLFKGIPISGYLSLNMGGLAAVNDAIGGVTLTPVETVKRGDIVITKDQEINLNGEQAYAYLRTRDVDEFGSANDRLERQLQYVEAMMKKLLADPGKANRMYEEGADYIVASIDLPKLVKDAKDMTLAEDKIYTLPGDTEFKDGFEQYHLDEDGMIKLILDVFYEELP